MSIWVVLTERSYLLPLDEGKAKRKHSKVLLMFWSFFFINENISLIQFKHGPIFLFRYACTLLVLILGFLAPGIQEIRTKVSDDESTDDENKETKVISFQ